MSLSSSSSSSIPTYAESRTPTTRSGTDYSTPPDAPWPALHLELEELVAEGGLTPMEAIVSATRVGASVIGLRDSHGTLEAGNVVDFVLLESDPLADIGNLRSVKAVWKNAARFGTRGISSSRIRVVGRSTRRTVSMA